MKKYQIQYEHKKVIKGMSIVTIAANSEEEAISLVKNGIGELIDYIDMKIVEKKKNYQVQLEEDLPEDLFDHMAEDTLPF